MLTEEIMKKHQVDKAVAFFHIYQEGKVFYDALPVAEKSKYQEKAEVAMEKYRAKYKVWKVENKEWLNSRRKNNSAFQFSKQSVGAYKHWLASNRAVLTARVMALHCVSRRKAKRMLFREAKGVYNGLPVSEKKRYEELAEAEKRKCQVKRNKGIERVSFPPGRPLSAYKQWIADNRSMLIKRIMAKCCVDKPTVYKMLYKEARPFYEALPEAEKRK